MEKEMRLIDVNDVYKLFDNRGLASLHVADIDTIQRVDAVEVVHGRWEKFNLGLYDFALRLKCSNCGRVVYERGFKYCPECGARMNLEVNGA